jgi:large subunit ribosomal protein L29
MNKEKNYAELSTEQLKTELEQLLKERFSLRIQKVTGQQAVKSHLLKNIRRNVARIKTILTAKGVRV